MKIIIPARGGSKRIPNKNLIKLHNRPLISYVIEASQKLTDEVYVSTDSPEIQAAAEKCGAKVVKRPASLATDTATTNSVIKHFLDTVKNTDSFACVQATSPLLESNYLQSGFEKLAEKNYDSIVSVTKSTSFFWNEYGAPINFEKNRKPRTQDMQPWYAENGAFYITTKKSFLQNINLVGKNVGFIVMPQLLSFEIDTYEDYILVEKIKTALAKEEK